MKVHVEVPRESIRPHDIPMSGKERLGEALFNISGDGFNYSGIPFGPELYKILKQELPAMAARKNEDIEWEPDVSGANKGGILDDVTLDSTDHEKDEKFFTKDVDEKTGEKYFKPTNLLQEVANADDYKRDTELRPSVRDELHESFMMGRDPLFGKNRKMLTKILGDALASGDFTKLLEPKITLRDMDKEHNKDRYKHEKYPAYDFTQWSDGEMPKTEESWDVVMKAPEAGSYDTQLKQGRRMYVNPKDIFAAKMEKNAGKWRKKEAEDFKKEEDRERRDKAEKEDSFVPGRQGVMKEQYRKFCKWAARELGLDDWHQVKDKISPELFDKIYQYDENTHRGYYDRNQLMDALKGAMASGQKLSDERFKNIATTLEGIM
jgi:hypothetical protein